jgi:alpha-N-arabinofuranosidase
MTGMERNSDIVLRSCYAPLFVNINVATATAPKAWQWDSDLIGYDALNSFGSPSYYVQKMFNTYIGDKIIPVTGDNVPTQTRPATKRDSTAGVMPKPIAAMFYVATKDTKKGMIYLKVVNATGTPQTADVNLTGIAKLSADAELIAIKGSSPEDTNTITEPEKIMPVTTKVKGISKAFTRTFEPYSVSILCLKLVQ